MKTLLSVFAASLLSLRGKALARQPRQAVQDLA
jgi:hypothetical protein